MEEPTTARKTWMSSRTGELCPTDHSASYVIRVNLDEYLSFLCLKKSFTASRSTLSKNTVIFVFLSPPHYSRISNPRVLTHNPPLTSPVFQTLPGIHFHSYRKNGFQRSLRWKVSNPSRDSFPFLPEQQSYEGWAIVGFKPFQGFISIPTRCDGRRGLRHASFKPFQGFISIPTKVMQL
jgi:hypothetical protein